MGKRVQNLAGVIGQRQTAIIHAVVDEITAKPAENPIGLQLLPVVNVGAELIYTEQVSGMGGLLAERALGAPGQSSNVSSSTTNEFSPGYYQETKTFTERDLLFLRRLGSMGERGVTGVTSGELDYLSRASQGLKVKVQNRLNKLAWDVLFTGLFIYRGVVKYNFGLLPQHIVYTATDWTGTTATPFSDLFNILKLNPEFYKYIIRSIKMNPRTAASMLTSQEARVLITNNSQAAGDVNKIMQILYPGLPKIDVIEEAWQDETTVNGNIVLGQAQYFLPDNQMLLEIEMGGSLFSKYGELQMTYNMNDPSATLEEPSFGTYTFVDEEGLKRRQAPYVDVVTGFNGGPNLMRAREVLIVKTKPGI